MTEKSCEVLVPFEAVLIDGFNEPLMCDMHVSTAMRYPESFESFSNAWKAACERASFDITTALVEHHRENVLMFSAHCQDGLRSVLQRWLERCSWGRDRELVCRESTSARPLEDGYFRCLQITARAAELNQAKGDVQVTWSQPMSLTRPINALLSEFWNQEIDRLGTHHTNYDPNIFGPCGDNHPTHYFFDFSEGAVALEFAGSVWSQYELRFWSRAVQLHK